MNIACMSATTINDSSVSLPLHGAGYPEGEKLPVAAAAVATKESPIVRTKRPRPTFDDGSSTRVFKFPSRTYPKSSFYVTGTEIIVRIKKARKKWKLVIPKKRSTSYRTNRWFTKPRWIEIDLTYTQAVKLGLVAPKAPSHQTNEEMSAIPAVASELLVEGDGASAGDAASSVETENTDDETVFELDPDVAEPDHHFDDDARAPSESQDAVQVVDEADRPDVLGSAAHHGPEVPPEHEMVPEIATDVGIAEPLASVDALEGPSQPVSAASSSSIILLEPPDPGVPCQSVPRSTSPIYAVRLGGEITPALAAKGRESARPARKVTATLLMISVLGLGASAVTWIAGLNHIEMQIVDSAPCAQPGPAASCNETIVTGAIGRDDGPVAPEPRSHTAPAAPAFAAPAETEQLDFAAPDGSETAIKPAERLDNVPAAVALADRENMQLPHDNLAIKQRLEPAVSSAEHVSPPPHNAADRTPACIELSADAQTARIQFDYARSRLDHATLASLERFAVKLRSCTSALVLIQGHTDSDGDAERNQTLSVRRAQAVWEHLVNAGARADQLLVMGFGGSRPEVPNVSAENKLRNRRAVLVTELPR